MLPLTKKVNKDIYIGTYFGAAKAATSISNMQCGIKHNLWYLQVQIKCLYPRFHGQEIHF